MTNLFGPNMSISVGGVHRKWTHTACHRYTDNRFINGWEEVTKTVTSIKPSLILAATAAVISYPIWT